MGSKVTVEVVLDRRGQRVIVSKEMQTWIVEDAFKGLDHPSVTADAFSSRPLRLLKNG